MLKSQPLVTMLDQQKLLQLLQMCPGQAGVTLRDKMLQGRVARPGGIPSTPGGPELPKWGASSQGCWLVQWSFVRNAKGMEKGSGAAHRCWVQMFFKKFFFFPSLLKIIDNIVALVIIMMMIMLKECCLREG